VAVSEQQIVDLACTTLERYGLAGLSMRRLARELGVQPGALYYHVASKQELLVAVADRILVGSGQRSPANDVVVAAQGLRTALLAARDGAEVVSFAYALRPDAFEPLRELDGLFAKRLPADEARWAAETLIHYVLGFVAKEQNQAELIRVKVVPEEIRPYEPAEAFLFGVRAIVRGVAAD
jgi:TetR/AcrR family transcriptional regulator, tetracycline repressor protein